MIETTRAYMGIFTAELLEKERQGSKEVLERSQSSIVATRWSECAVLTKIEELTG